MYMYVHAQSWHFPILVLKCLDKQASTEVDFVNSSFVAAFESSLSVTLSCF